MPQRKKKRVNRQDFVLRSPFARERGGNRTLLFEEVASLCVSVMKHAAVRGAMASKRVCSRQKKDCISSTSESVSEKTFLSWDFHEDCVYEITEDQKLSNLQCKVCTEHIAEIRHQTHQIWFLA